MNPQPTFKEWKKENPGKSLNDYYIKYPYSRSNDHEQNNRISDYKLRETNIRITESLLKKKSVFTSVWFTFIFGPFGLFYSSKSTAIKMLFLPIIGALGWWILPIICQATATYNDFFCGVIDYYKGVFSIFILFIYLPLCLVLSVTMVKKYNKSLLEDLKD